MIGNIKRDQFFEVFFRSERQTNYSIMDYLENAIWDDKVIVNLKENTFKQAYKVEGKYMIPSRNLATYDELYHFAYEFVVHPDDREIYEEARSPKNILNFIKNSRFPNFAYCHLRYKVMNDTYRWVEICLVKGIENGISDDEIYFYVFDITNWKIREENRNATFDVDHGDFKDLLTGLYIEKAFIDESIKLVKTKKEATWCVLSIDIEHFRLFDEWLGREKGNFLLAKFGEILLHAQKERNCVTGYFGKDDFFVTLDYDKAYIKKLYDELAEATISFGYSIGFMPVVGISFINECEDFLEAIDKATIASSKAKNDVKNRIVIYDPSIHEREEKEIQILSDFNAALKNDEITFYLQPQCRISTGKVVGAESLARWVKKDGTIVHPLDFIPVLEKYGFIADLDKYLWEKVCVWLKSWIDAGHKPIPISLNVSRADIFTVDIADFFIKLTKKYRISPSFIKLEITESAYAETSSLIETLVKNLKKHGFLVLMDDFGSGYSSLNMLSNLDIDAVKLDADFLNIDNDFSRGVHILESVVNMTKQISLPIIVEGVENKKQCDFLVDLGCRYVQGYYFYKPMPYKELEKIIANEDNIDDRGFIQKSNEQFRLREFLDENVYSDTMLNNILGPVALYALHGDDVDIVRYNEQFYKVVDTPDFSDRLRSIQKFMPQEDVPRLIEALKEAKNNKLNGSLVYCRFYKLDGTLTKYSLRFYYLNNKNDESRFYGSVRNLTELEDLKDRMNLVATYTSDSLIFLQKINGVWLYQVASHGLASEMGLSFEEFEKELNDHVFFQRVDKEDLSESIKAFESRLTNEEINRTITVNIRTNLGTLLPVSLRFEFVKNKAANIAYILKLSLAK